MRENHQRNSLGKLLPGRLGRPRGPEASAQPVAEMSLEALSLLASKNSRTEPTQWESWWQWQSTVEIGEQASSTESRMPQGLGLFDWQCYSGVNIYYLGRRFPWEQVLSFLPLLDRASGLLCLGPVWFAFLWLCVGVLSGQASDSPLSWPWLPLCRNMTSSHPVKT